MERTCNHYPYRGFPSRCNRPMRWPDLSINKQISAWNKIGGGRERRSAFACLVCVNTKEGGGEALASPFFQFDLSAIAFSINLCRQFASSRAIILGVYIQVYTSAFCYLPGGLRSLHFLSFLSTAWPGISDHQLPDPFRIYSTRFIRV